MGITKRIFDLARANLNSLLDRAGGEPLGEFSDDELAEELERRKGRQRRADEQRAAREAAEQAARDKAARERAARKAAGGSVDARTQQRSSSSSSSSSSQSKPPAPKPRTRSEVLYARLETPYGADLDTVRKNFHRLMRKYHPDVAGHSPEQQKAATELSSELTLAYHELELLLAKRR